MPARRFLVTGRVQGVGYRFFTLDHALANELRGFVRNLADGSVEVVAGGDIVALDRFRSALEAGPAAARVESVTEETIEFQEQWDDFIVK